MLRASVKQVSKSINDYRFRRLIASESSSRQTANDNIRDKPTAGHIFFFCCFHNLRRIGIRPAEQVPVPSGPTPDSALVSLKVIAGDDDQVLCSSVDDNLRNRSPTHRSSDVASPTALTVTARRGAAASVASHRLATPNP